MRLEDIHTVYKLYVQWNLSNPDTNGTEGSVIVSEVSSFQRLKCMQEWYLGWEKVSCLEVSSIQHMTHTHYVVVYTSINSPH